MSVADDVDLRSKPYLSRRGAAASLERCLQSNLKALRLPLQSLVKCQVALSCITKFKLRDTAAITQIPSCMVTSNSLT